MVPEHTENATEGRAPTPKWGHGPYESLVDGPRAPEALDLGTPARGVLVVIALGALTVMCWFLTNWL